MGLLSPLVICLFLFQNLIRWFQDFPFCMFHFISFRLVIVKLDLYLRTVLLVSSSFVIFGSQAIMPRREARQPLDCDQFQHDKWEKRFWEDLESIHKMHWKIRLHLPPTNWYFLRSHQQVEFSEYLILGLLDDLVETHV